MKYEKAIAIAILAFFVPAAGGAGLATLRAESSPNTVVVEQAELPGVGADVQTTLARGEKLEGLTGPIRRSLRTLDETGFVLVRDHRTDPLEIPYLQAQQAGSSMSRDKKVALTVAVLAGIAAGAVWAYKTFSVSRGTD